MSGNITWHLVRASGIVAMVLLATSVLWGLALSTPFLGARRRPNKLEPIHRYLSGATLVMVGFHLLFLWADSFVTFTVADLLVPLHTNWHPVEVAMGVIAFWLLVVVQASSWLKNRMPHRTWRALHYLSFVTFFAVAIHAGTAGTDGPALAFRIGLTALVVAMGGVVAARVVSGTRRSRTMPTPHSKPEAVRAAPGRQAPS